MRLFLTILEGPNPRDAVPILATEDEGIIQRVAADIMARLSQDGRGQNPVDRPVCPASLDDAPNCWRQA